jgi:hypothetical protein
MKISSVRKIPTNRRSVRGNLSWPGGGQVAFESHLERDFLYLQRHSLSVLEVVSQPCTIPFGAGYEYTPDFLVIYRTTLGPAHLQKPSLLVEVKPRSEWRANWRAWSTKWKAARRHAIEMDWRFTIMDEERIRGQALENIKFLRRYDDLVYDEGLSLEIIEDVEARGVVTFGDLLSRRYPEIHRAEGIGHLWHLLATRRLDCDINLRLSYNTELWIPGHE